MRKLSTGVKINSARDDAAGLAIANKLDIQTIGLNRANQNSLDGISLIQTADGALSTVMDMMQRMRELAVQAANGVLTAEDQSKIQTEAAQLVEEITANANKTEFNKIKILSGEADTVFVSRIEDNGVVYSADRISKILFVSESVPPGRLTYTITRPALPAEAMIRLNDIVPNAIDASFSINGVPVNIFATDDKLAVYDKITKACQLAQVDVIYDDDYAYFATKKAGADQHLTLSGHYTALGNGSDVQIADLKFLNNDAFNNAIGMTAQGNEITISSANGQSIRLGLKVLFQPAGGGAAPSEKDFAYEATPANIPVTGLPPLYIDIKNYGELYLQVGPSYNQHMPVQIPKVTSETLGFVEFKDGAAHMLLDYLSTEGATRSMGMLDRAMAEVSDVRAKLGAYQNRLENTVRNLDTAAYNTEISRSRIQDTDMAYTMAQYTQLNVKYQAGISILAQANQRPQQILSLLQ